MDRLLAANVLLFFTVTYLIFGCLVLCAHRQAEFHHGLLLAVMRRVPLLERGRQQRAPQAAMELKVPPETSNKKVSRRGTLEPEGSQGDK